MVFIRLSSFTFMLMFTLLEARDSIYKHPHYQGIVDSKFSPPSEQMEAKDIQTILFKGIKPNVVQAEEEGTKMRLNGRKMASEGGFKKEKAKAKEKTKMSLKGRNSKISGRNNNASRMQTSEAKPEDSKSKGRTGEMNWLRHARKHKGKIHRGASDDSFQNFEFHDLEADNEVWTLMHRDYPGNGGGRRKPPSNNR